MPLGTLESRVRIDLSPRTPHAPKGHFIAPLDTLDAVSKTNRAPIGYRKKVYIYSDLHSLTVQIEVFINQQSSLYP